MNLAKNQSPKLPSTSKNQTSRTPQEGEIGSPEVSTKSPAMSDRSQDSVQDDRELQATPRNQPIPPPSHPKQYRAIGLIRGKYQSSEEQLTQGTLVTTEGINIDAVLLGRVISLVKNHLDLEKEHLWVVYPRTKTQDDSLHVQIVGVWEPETLDRTAEEVPSSQEMDDGYFSIRGEVIFFSHEEKSVVIKIKQFPRKEGEKPKFFKLKLKGILEGRPLRHFWDLTVRLQGELLTIEEGVDLGFAQKRKPNIRRDDKPKIGSRKPFKPNKPNSSGSSGSSIARPVLQKKPTKPQ
jgi:hypothetical protein